MGHSKSNASLIYVETITDKKSTITLFDYANTQLQNAVFFNILTTMSQFV